VSPVLLSNGGETLRAAALAGMGLAALPDWAVASDIAEGTLVQVLKGWRTPESGIYAVYPSNRLMAAKVKVFVDAAARALRAPARA
jgi:DNA-binding transcriptional LysR family regulator